MALQVPVPATLRLCTARTRDVADKLGLGICNLVKRPASSDPQHSALQSMYGADNRQIWRAAYGSLTTSGSASSCALLGMLWGCFLGHRPTSGAQQPLPFSRELLSGTAITSARAHVRAGAMEGFFF